MKNSFGAKIQTDSMNRKNNANFRLLLREDSNFLVNLLNWREILIFNIHIYRFKLFLERKFKLIQLSFRLPNYLLNLTREFGFVHFDESEKLAGNLNQLTFYDLDSRHR